MTDAISEEKEKKIYSPEEIHEMFNSGFLPILQKFAKRTKKERFPAEEIACFQCRLILEFSDLEAPLTYESIMGQVNLQLQPVLQKDVDKQKEEEKLRTQEKDAKDTEDA